ncbi:kinesin light chain 1 [Zopfia rhizophila CBS 207.26]|uniref:Kinesin light chain 1 n=1 Tax=Zopfia rhizophila CBS 207.26 TaxID=1314779 RepID=A0A6A6DPU8_9PEZI|nr:kinesin light chain 1 [Zopfia rhizophila CBS 207.26]
MRLLECNSRGEFSLTKDFIGDEEVPPYAILSHTWQEGQEVTFDDLGNDTGKSKAGYDKIRFCAQQAERDGLRYFWVDTCCINKADHIELQDAINSMFRWYQNATRCYVYLSDALATEQEASSGFSEFTWEPAFRASRWFTRGWTLQELLAPRAVKFFSREGKPLGDKRTLEQQIHEITGIAILALRGTPLYEFDVEERLSWVKDRRTTRKEDKAYSLLGIFDIYMPLIYGEGEENAFKRLRKKIDKSAKDLLQQQVSTQICRMHQDIVRDMEGVSKAPWVVPFLRPLSFVGRETQLAQLGAHILAEGCQRFAIYGLGGCGKTALALESVYRTREQQPTRAIFWVPAVSQQSFEQAYREIGMLLRIPGIADDKADVKQLVKAKLSDERFGQWLMVVDNADDVGVLFGPLEEGSGADRLIDYLPRSRKGSIVFTTRTRVAAVKLAESNVIALGELDKAEATEVLKTRLLQEHQHQLENEETVDEFLDMLSFLALAIVQAVAFVNTNDITLSEYIAHYRNSEREAINLLSEEFEDQGRYRETKNPVATTWYISFEQIRKQNELGADYLSFMACTANNDIPASMLLANGSQVEQTKAIGMLKAYAFIAERQPQREGQRGQTQGLVRAFDVHPLVHLAMSGWLKAHDQWNLWTEKTLTRLVEIVPFGDHDTREVWTAYLPHATHVVDLPEVYVAEGRMSLLDRIGHCEQTLGHYKAAVWALQQLLERQEKVLGKEHPDTLTSMNNVALVLRDQGKYAEAEKMHREELALSEKAVGKEHPDTLTSMSNVARALSGQGKYAEAEKMHRETLALREKVLGTEHPRTLTSMNNVALALSDQGKYAEAEKMHREELALSEKAVGKEHPDTLTSMSNVAWALSGQGKYAEAEKMHRETQALREKAVGKEHPDTLTSMNGRH